MKYFLYFCSLNDKMGDCVVKKREYAIIKYKRQRLQSMGQYTR